MDLAKSLFGYEKKLTVFTLMLRHKHRLAKWGRKWMFRLDVIFTLKQPALLSRLALKKLLCTAGECPQKRMSVTGTNCIGMNRCELPRSISRNKAIPQRVGYADCVYWSAIGFAGALQVA